MIEIKGKRGELLHAIESGSLVRWNFRGAHLEGAQLPGVNLERAVFIRADLSGANLQGANLRKACFFGANLEEAELEKALLKGAKYDRATRWPAGFQPARHGAKLFSQLQRK